MSHTENIDISHDETERAMAAEESTTARRSHLGVYLFWAFHIGLFFFTIESIRFANQMVLYGNMGAPPTDPVLSESSFPHSRRPHKPTISKLFPEAAKLEPIQNKPHKQRYQDLRATSKENQSAGQSSSSNNPHFKNTKQVQRDSDDDPPNQDTRIPGGDLKWKIIKLDSKRKLALKNKLSEHGHLISDRDIRVQEIRKKHKSLLGKLLQKARGVLKDNSSSTVKTERKLRMRMGMGMMMMRGTITQLQLFSTGQLPIGGGQVGRGGPSRGAATAAGGGGGGGGRGGGRSKSKGRGAPRPVRTNIQIFQNGQFLPPLGTIFLPPRRGMMMGRDRGTFGSKGRGRSKAKSRSKSSGFRTRFPTFTPATPRPTPRFTPFPTFGTDQPSASPSSLPSLAPSVEPSTAPSVSKSPSNAPSSGVSPAPSVSLSPSEGPTAGAVNLPV
jgi:hypothetical protein